MTLIAGVRTNEMLMNRTVVAMILAAGTAMGQVPAPAALRPATATLAGKFKSVSSVRELSDGRVLVSDPRGKMIAVADLKSGRVEQIGRVGGGPGEYLNVLPLFRLGADSSVMPDAITHRWLMFDGTTISASLPPDAIVVREVGPVLGIDRRGNIMTTRHSGRDAQTTSPPDRDSIVLLLFHPSTAKTDSIALIVGGLKAFTGTAERITITEPATLAADGWVAIVRANPNRVEWRSPDGKWTIGPPLPIELGARTKSENRLWPTFPDHLATLMLQPIATADGELLVRRERTQEHPEPIYAVISHEGTIIRQVTLGLGESIVGFGEGTIYVSHADSKGTIRLDRHPWP